MPNILPKILIIKIINILICTSNISIGIITRVRVTLSNRTSIWLRLIGYLNIIVLGLTIGMLQLDVDVHDWIFTYLGCYIRIKVLLLRVLYLVFR